MTEDIILLKKEFIKIKKQEWIKSKRQGPTGIGYTFESLIQKAEDRKYIPDFNIIEIKCKHYYSKGYITLFNAKPDLFLDNSIQYITHQYGYPSKLYPNQKVFNVSVNSHEYTKLGWYKKFILKVDKKFNHLLFVASNKNKVEIPTGWSFTLLKERVNSKIKYIAIPIAKSKIVNNTEYLKFIKIEFYEFYGFDKFIKLLEEGKIRITFKIGIFTKDPKKGNLHDHGTGFEINKKDILKLYKRIY